MVKVPNMNRCCCCCPLRQGILLFGIINIIFSIAAIAWLVFNTELNYVHGSLELATCTVLYSIFGMSVILNILLLVAGCQKDINMLRLFNCYAVTTALAALVPTVILLTRAKYYDVGVALFAIAVQFYVILLVRSAVINLQLKFMSHSERLQSAGIEETIDVSDIVSLL